MGNQHYFVIFAERNNAGVIEWHVDTEMPLASGDDPVYNSEKNEWESIENNYDEDLNITNDLIIRLTQRQKPGG